MYLKYVLEDYAPKIKIRKLFEKEIKIQGVRSFTKDEFSHAKNILDYKGDELLNILNVSIQSGGNINAIMENIEDESVDKVIVRMR